MRPMMRKFPYLAQYKANHQWGGVIVACRGPADAIVVYIPPTKADLLTSPIYDVHLFDIHAPSNSELDVYSGAVTIRNSAEPALSV